MKKFLVEYRVEGTVTEIIYAETLEEAKEKADDKAFDEDWIPDLDDVRDVFSYVQKMTKVREEDTGKEYWTTYVWPRKGVVEIGDNADDDPGRPKTRADASEQDTSGPEDQQGTLV